MDRKQIFRRILWWVLTVVCAAAIWFFSSQNVADSSAVSESVTGSLLDWLPFFKGLCEAERIRALSEWEAVVRALAHVAEFAALGSCLSCLWRSYQKPWVIPTALIGAVYAVSDEWHQKLAAAGRAFEWTDILKDIAGIALGIGAVWAVTAAVAAAHRRNKSYGVSSRHAG